MESIAAFFSETTQFVHEVCQEWENDYGNDK